jgi:hypothetical protein
MSRNLAIVGARLLLLPTLLFLVTACNARPTPSPIGNVVTAQPVSTQATTDTAIPLPTNTSAPAVQATATTQPSALDPQQQAEAALATVEIADLNSVLVNDLNGRIVIDFNMRDDNVTVALDQMGQMLCAIQANGPADYAIRFGGRMSNGMGGISATISPAAIQSADCTNPGAIDFESIADEYSVASGLQN